MKEYIAEYLENNNTHELNVDSDKARVVKIYNSPSPENLEEQIQLSRSQGFNKFSIAIGGKFDKNTLEEGLNSVYKNIFSEGIHVLTLNEGDDNQDTITTATPTNAESVENFKPVIPTAPQDQMKPTMIIYNPIGLLPFNSSGTLSASVTNFIDGAMNFINAYSKSCRAIYIVDTRLDDNTNKAIDPFVTRFLNNIWLSENNYPTYANFFTDFQSNGTSVRHKSYKNLLNLQQDMIPGSYLFISSEFVTVLNKSLKNLTNGTYKLATGTKNDLYINLKNKDGYQGFFCGQLKLNDEDIVPTKIENIYQEMGVINEKGDLKDIKITPRTVDSYLVSVLQWYDNDNVFKSSISESKIGKAYANRISTMNAQKPDRLYKNQKFDKYQKDSYWNWRNKYYQQKASEDPEWAEAEKNIDKFLLNKNVDDVKYTDKSLEKAYNAKYLVKDIMDSDTVDDRFDTRRYSQPDKTINGVAGYQVYKVDKRRSDISDRIDEINKEIEELDDINQDDIKKINELNDEIKQLSDEDDELQASLEDSKRAADAAEKKTNITTGNNVPNKDSNTDKDEANNMDSVSNEKIILYKNTVARGSSVKALKNSITIN